MPQTDIQPILAADYQAMSGMISASHPALIGCSCPALFLRATLNLRRLPLLLLSLAPCGAVGATGRSAEAPHTAAVRPVAGRDAASCSPILAANSAGVS